MPNNNQRTIVNLRNQSGESDVLKLSPPIAASDANLQRIIDKIYDDLNVINNAVNQKKAANVEHKGKQGDIRIVPDPSDPRIQHLQGFGTNGWTQFATSSNTTYKGAVSSEFNHSKPDYDSGWKDITKDTKKDFIHNLNTRYFRILLLFRFTGTVLDTDYKGNEDNVRTSDIHYLNTGAQTFGTSGVDDIGFGVVSIDGKKLRLWTGDNGIFYIINNEDTVQTVALQGDVRLFLHKIPLGK